MSYPKENRMTYEYRRPGRRNMKSLSLSALVALTATTGVIAYQHTQLHPRPRIGAESSILHNGWTITPAGTQQKTGDMLMGGQFSPDKKLFAVVNAGYNEHHLYLLDAVTGNIKQSFPLPRAWNGVAWSPDGATLYVSGGGLARVYRFARTAQGTFEATTPIQLPSNLTPEPAEKPAEALTDKPEPAGEKGQAYVSGLAVSPDGKRLFVANFATDSLYAYSLPEGKMVTHRKLDTLAHPYCLRLAPDGKRLFVTESALKRIEVLDTANLQSLKTIPTDGHPNDLLFTQDGRLFVSCGSGNTVVALDAQTGQLRERISVTLTPQSPAGTTPNSLALSPDGKTLYVADSDNNDVAVIDITRTGRGHVRGFIPTAWYPTLVCATPDGKSILIGSGKGMGTGPNNRDNTKTQDPVERHYTYVGTLLHGLIGTVAVPDEKALVSYTRQVVANTPYSDALLKTPLLAPPTGSSPIPSKVGESSPIKHILYIIKENRTYDQVLGDLKDAQGKRIGNGDPSLTLFGETVTPNIHALAREFVTLDNTYCNGDVSGNGHPWSTAAYGTDIGERAWMQAYGGHAEWPLKDPDIYPPVGRIWDRCEQKGLSWVSYYYTWTTDNTTKHMSEIWKKGMSSRRDTENAELFIADLKQYEQTGKMPSFMIMSLREDHTNGTSPNAFTPEACVASNDQGVGKIVEALSKSKFWSSTALFVIQDDAQDGPDHVDAHRTEALVISPYTRKRGVDSTFYTTASLLRTMELILGLAPMSQYDAAATPMYRAFQKMSDKLDLTPYTCRKPGIDLNAKNGRTAFGAKESSKMDFSKPDQLTMAQVDQLNRILWHSAKGANTPYPGPVHRALLHPSGASSLSFSTNSERDED